jgi:predicted Rossmann fold nucleotide-binding protein DprA/Smf involved in DNA uptake
MNRGNRDALMNGQLVLISPYDPSAGFNVGHAMQRNKLIYSLADAALVVNSDFEKGGTWSGAVEQLDMPATMPVYVRAIGKTSKGLEALRRRGALPWPNPSCESELLEIFSGKVEYTERGVQSELSFAHEPSSNYDISVSQPRTSAPPDDTK